MAAALIQPLVSTESATGATLDQWPTRVPAQVLDITPPAHAPEWRNWLEDIGFLPGESVEILARARPGMDPLMIRVGSSTFALRKVEAACIVIGSAD